MKQNYLSIEESNQIKEQLKTNNKKIAALTDKLNLIIENFPDIKKFVESNNIDKQK